MATVGDSRDNFYYFEGINVTDSVSGVAGAFINTEIIQQQNVTTGGLAAEFIGATGLVSNVVTKSGGNDFSGSVNYYLQNDSLVESNKNRADDSFSTYDTAFTLGGPIARDKAWFFGSFRLVESRAGRLRSRRQLPAYGYPGRRAGVRQDQLRADLQQSAHRHLPRRPLGARRQFRRGDLESAGHVRRSGW